jgi:hypothetical protein
LEINPNPVVWFKEILMLIISRKDAVSVCVGVGYVNAPEWAKKEGGKARFMRKLTELATEEDFDELEVDKTLIEDDEERAHLNTLLVALRTSKGEFKLTGKGESILDFEQETKDDSEDEDEEKKEESDDEAIATSEGVDGVLGGSGDDEVTEEPENDDEEENESDAIGEEENDDSTEDLAVEDDEENESKDDEGSDENRSTDEVKEEEEEDFTPIKKRNPFKKKKSKAKEIRGIRPSKDSNLFICGNVIRRHGHENGVTEAMVGEAMDGLTAKLKAKGKKKPVDEKQVRWSMGHAWHAINGFLNND